MSLDGVDLLDKSKRYVAACVRPAADPHTDTWILGTIVAENATDGSITVLDADPDENTPSQYPVEKGKWVNFPNPPKYPTKGWESCLGEKLLSLWAEGGSEISEFSTTFYNAELQMLMTRPTDGQLTHLQLKFEDDESLRLIPLKFVLRPPKPVKKSKSHKDHKSKSKSKSNRSSTSAAAQRHSPQAMQSVAGQHSLSPGADPVMQKEKAPSTSEAGESRKRKEISPTKSDKEAKRSKDKRQKKKARQHESSSHRTAKDSTPALQPLDVDKCLRDMRQQAEVQGVLMDEAQGLQFPEAEAHTQVEAYKSLRGHKRRWAACRWITTEPSKDPQHNPQTLLATPYVVLF